MHGPGRPTRQARCGLQGVGFRGCKIQFVGATRFSESENPTDGKKKNEDFFINKKSKESSSYMEMRWNNKGVWC